MSVNNPNGELPPGMVAGEYVQLDLDLFLKAFSTMLHVMAGIRTVRQDLLAAEAGAGERPITELLAVDDALVAALLTGDPHLEAAAVEVCEGLKGRVGIGHVQTSSPSRQCHCFIVGSTSAANRRIDASACS
jgi:hypothetical protein